jgi:hypothetical protein
MVVYGSDLTKQMVHSWRARRWALGRVKRTVGSAVENLSIESLYTFAGG